MFKTYKGFKLAGALAIAILAGDDARAAVYDVNFTGAVFDVAALVTTDASNLAKFASGTVTNTLNNVTTQITDVAPLGANTAFTYDNQFTGAAPYLTDNGILLASSNASFFYNLYFDGTNYYLSTFDPTGDISSPYYGQGDLGSLSVSLDVGAVPEPTTWAMMMIGLFCLGALTCRRTNGLPAA